MTSKSEKSLREMVVELIPVIDVGNKLKDVVPLYKAGTPFCSLTDIEDDVLTKIVIAHTKDLREGTYEREQACSLWGGYVLKVDGLDKFFPQCCGELSDIRYWERVSTGNSSYCGGHPEPVVRFESDNIVFEFVADESDAFNPMPPELILTIDRVELNKAVEVAKEQLKIFEKKLEHINRTENLDIENIGGLLIWDNGNYK